MKFKKEIKNHKIDYFLKAIEINKNINNPNTATLYNDLGLEYRDIGQDHLALEYFQKALSIYREHLGEKHLFTATAMNNVGAAYKRLGEYNQALEHLNKAIELKSNIKLSKKDPALAVSYFHLAEVYFAMEDIEIAYDLVSKAVNLFETTGKSNIPRAIEAKELLKKIEVNYPFIAV